MERKALTVLRNWWNLTPSLRKPLVIRGARQTGKSYLVRDFCARKGLSCLEINFEKEPSLRRLFVEGPNSKTVTLLEAHFQKTLKSQAVLFLDEIQAAPEVFSRLRYFFEDNSEIPVIAAGSLLEFTLAEMEYSVPVGRIEYLYLGPMDFEEYLRGIEENSMLELIRNWQPRDPKTDIPEVFHERLLSHVRDFSIVGGMPEAVHRFASSRDFLGCESVHRSILETYRSDFGKFRKRIPLERLERIFDAIPLQVGKKWVHARINPHEKALALETALEALCKAKVAHPIFHSSGNGVPLAAERKDNLYKVIFMDVGLMGIQLGLRITDLIEPEKLTRVNEGAVAEQWIGQQLLNLRSPSETPSLYYWVREKSGSMAEVDYLIQYGTHVFPIEIKAGLSSKSKSLQVFLSEKKNSPFGIHFSLNPISTTQLNSKLKLLELPFYLVGQLPRILESLHR